MALIKKNICINITKKITPTTGTATVIETATCKCGLNPLINYSQLLFPPFFCFIHFLLTLIFIVYCFNFHYSCITIFTSHLFIELYTTSKYNISNNKKRVGTEFVICLLNYIIIFSNIFLCPTVVCFDCTDIHYDLIILVEFIHKLKISSKTSDLSRHTVLDILPILIKVVSLFDH